MNWKATNRLLCVLVGLTFLLSGCAGQVRAPSLSADACGSWFVNVPEPDGRFLYFVGVSRRNGTLAEARNNALVEASEQFVKYTGMAISIVDRYLATVDKQLASQLVDPTVSEEKRRTIRARAFVSRVKATTWCDAGRYESAVLMTVPTDEPERVAKWASRRRRELLLSAATLFDSANSQAGAGRPVSALESHHAARVALDEAGYLTVDDSPPVASVTLAEVEREEAAVRGGISLKLKGEAGRTIEPEAAPEPFVLEAGFTRGESSMPIKGLAILAVDQSGQTHRGVTDSSGIYSLPVATFSAPGERRYLAEIDTGALRGRLSPAALSSLNKHRVAFSIKAAWEGVAQKAGELVAGLARQVEGKPISVVVENFTYKDAEGSLAAGEFALRFADYLEEALAKSEAFSKKNRVSRKGMTRGLEELTSASSPSAQAHASGAEAVLYGKYFEEGERVVVQGRLADQGEKLLAAESVRIKKSAIPADWRLVPVNYKEQLAAGGNAAEGGDFRLDLWVDKGNGGVYREGENIYINVRPQVEVYLKLINIAADGTQTVVFPNSFQRENRIRGGQTVSIPSLDAPFDIKVMPPSFGLETLIAFASTRPFPADQEEEPGGGNADSRITPEALLSKHRNLAPDAKSAEARVTFTTVKE